MPTATEMTPALHPPKISEARIATPQRHRPNTAKVPPCPGSSQNSSGRSPDSMSCSPSRPFSDWVQPFTPRSFATQPNSTAKPCSNNSCSPPLHWTAPLKTLNSSQTSAKHFPPAVRFCSLTSWGIPQNPRTPPSPSISLSDPYSTPPPLQDFPFAPSAPLTPPANYLPPANALIPSLSPPSCSSPPTRPAPNNKLAKPQPSPSRPL